MGELILFVPLILLAWWLDILEPVTLSMVTFFVCKWAYRVEKSFHVKTQVCVALSYGLFLVIGLCSNGLAASVPAMQSQPMMPILAAVGTTWAWASAGDWQAVYMDAVYGPPFSCSTASAEQIHAMALRKGLKDEEIDFIVRAHRTQTRYKEFAVEYGITISAIKKRKTRLTRRLEN